MPTKFSEDELALLTEEELEGLLDETLVDDPEPNPEEAPDPAVPETEPQPAAPVAETEPVTDGEAEPAKPAGTEPAAQTPAAAPAPSPATDPEPASAEATPPAPPPQRLVARPTPFEAPGDLDQQIQRTRTAQRELAEKFDQGDLSASEYETQRQALDDKVFNLRMTGERARQSFDSQAHHWGNVTVSAFLADHPEYVPDSKLYESLDLQVRLLQVGEYQKDPFNPDIMQKAHEAVSALRAELGADRKPAPTAPGPEQEKVGKRPPLPPTLGALPAAGEDNLSGDGGRFAYLDRLAESDPLKYEDEMAKLSPTDRDRYLQAG